MYIYILWGPFLIPLPSREDHEQVAGGGCSEQLLRVAPERPIVPWTQQWGPNDHVLASGCCGT